MPTIINPFKGTDPTAQAIADFGASMFGNSGAGALRKEQIIAAQRANTETDNLGQRIAADPGGAAAILGTPMGQAILLASGVDPSKFNDLALGGAASQFGARAPQTQNAQVGAGQAFSNTADAFDANLAENARQFNQKPIDAVDIATGQPAFATQGNTAGFRPMESNTNFMGRELNKNFGNLDTLSELQQRALGVADKQGSQTPHSYLADDGHHFITYDGITDAATGQRLPSGVLISAQGSVKDVTGMDPTTTNRGVLQSQIPQQNTFIALADVMENLTNTHPEAFGAYGKIAGGVQELTQTADMLISQMGGKQAYDQLLDQAGQTLAQSGASPDILNHYNKAISAVDTLGPILAYQAASAIAQQSNRSVSDKDVELFTRIIGDPQGWLSSAPQVRTKMQILKATVKYSQTMVQDYLDKGYAVPDDIASQALGKAIAEITGSSEALTSAPDAAAPVAPDTGGPQEGDTATGPNGEKIILRNGQWVSN